MSSLEEGEVIEGQVIEGDVVDPAQPADAGLPEDPATANELLLDQLAEERQAAQSVFSDLQRVAAEFDNYRKRVQRDQVDIIDRASERVVLEMLAVVDSFEAAFTHEAQSPGEEKLLTGMRNTYELLISVLAKEGLEPIAAIGEPFDPTVHEAAQAPSDAGAHLVVSEELRRGYMLAGRLIRPALVAVDHA
ncbi:MAG: nucleotide exchange factor GrpE [Acidimicrobiia bacterium]|nr:nucleotide exchange factor GrpE [Acidimicrobiia bacterium]